MKVTESQKLRLTAEEAGYIEELILRNEYIIRAEVRSVLQDKFEQIGEDCISEIYLLACEKITVLKKHKNPDGWIVVAARNVAHNMARKHNTILNRTSEHILENIHIGEDVFDDALYNIWMRDGSIEKLINTLTPHEREIYELIYIKRLKPKEAAKLMCISDSTVRNIVAMIKKKIKNALETKLF